MLVFEDIIHLDDRSIQKVLKEVEKRDLATALKLCSSELKRKIFSNMSKRAVELISAEMEFMGPVKLTEVEEAQKRLIYIVHRLEEKGEIVLDAGEDR